MTAPIKVARKRRTNGQNGKILKHLQDGYSLTPKEAYEKFNTMNLAQRIAQLRNDGNEIQDTWVKVNENTRFKKYWIEFNL